MLRGSLRRHLARCLPVLCAVALTAPAEAGKLRAIPPAKQGRSGVHEHPHGPQRAARAPQPERSAAWTTLREKMPREARHGHMHLGAPLAPLFDRAELGKRRSALRGGLDTTVVRVCVIRVEFETDRMADRTTGDGRFMRTNPDPESIFIDPPPHDEEYFAAHIEAVNRYWSSMTYGCVRIEGDVYPRGQPFGAYLLSDMADYGPQSPDELFSIDGLTSYSRESLIVADADPDLVWSDYDVFFVVHAGSDWQNDVLQDTPLDIPTFSIAFSDSEVVVTDEGDTLTTMITYPETASQDGFLVGLNGGIAHEMGHQLGLFDLYNVETFAPTVAFYDVMDSGNLTSVFVPRPGSPDPPTEDDLVEIIGVLPSAVGAWSRWLVTFRFGNDPFEVKGDFPRARLRAIQDRGVLPAQKRWYRLSISDTEYFLIENRVDDLDGKDAQGFFNTALDQDDSTGVILGPIEGDSDEISHNYDLLLNPGVLIWHVDERQALANLVTGRGLNVDFSRRSVTIEEADGIVDIGSPFSFFPIGTDKETFHADNNANFTPNSNPSSASNLGSASGIAVRDIGPLGNVVRMDFTFGSRPRGWPQRIGEYGTSGGTSTTAADTDGDGQAEICALADSALWLLEFEDTDGDGDVDPSGSWPQPGGAGFLGTPEYTQTVGDLNGDGLLEVIAATDSGGVYCWDAAGQPFGGADSTGLLALFPVEDRPSWPPIPADMDADGTDELFLVTRDGFLRGWNVSPGSLADRFPGRPLLDDTTSTLDSLKSTLAFGDLEADGTLDGLVAFPYAGTVRLQRFNEAGRRTFRRAVPFEGSTADRVWMGLADVDRDAGTNDLEIFLALDGGWVALLDADARPMPGWPRLLPPPIAGPPAFGDLDGDGLLEIALTSGQTPTVYAFNYNGSQMPGWPITPELADFPGPPGALGGPAIADVDADGRQDVLVGLPDFTVRAFDVEGKLVDGFPFVTGNAVRSTPCVLDANGDGRLDLFVQSSDGRAYARFLAGQPSRTNPAWGMVGGGPKLHGSFPASRLPDVVSTGPAVLRGPVRVYPNPVRSTDEHITIRYTLGSQVRGATSVVIRLYNLAGEEVEAMEGPTFPNTENVVVLPGDRLASGVYVCSVHARSGDVEATQVGKFAVIR